MKRFLTAVIMGPMIGLSGIALAGEPMKLDTAQMDRVTAGLIINPIVSTSPTTFLLLTTLGSPFFGPVVITTGGGSADVSVTTGAGTVSVVASVHAGS